MSPTGNNQNTFIPTSFLPTGGIIFGTVHNNLVSDTGLIDLRDFRHCFGGFIGSDKFALSNFSDVDVTTETITSRRQTDNVVVSSLSAESTVGDVADILSVKSTGITLDWTTLSNSGYYNYLLFGGNSISNASLYQFDSPVTKGIVSYDIGFKPTVGIFATADISGSLTRTASDSSFCLGMTDGINQGSASYFSEDNVSDSNVRTQQAIGNVIFTIKTNPDATGIQATVIPSLQAKLDSFDSDGFNLDWINVEENPRRCWGIFLKGGSSLFESGIQSQSSVSTSFEPVTVLASSFGNTVGTGIKDSINFSMGISSGVINRSDVLAEKNNIGGGTTSRLETDKLLYFVDEDRNFRSSVYIDDVQSTGVSLNWDVIGGETRQFMMLFFGGATGDSSQNYLFQVGRLVLGSC